MQLPVPWLNYVYTRALGARAFYRHTLKRDANGTERLWHFWVRKSASMLFLAVMAGGMCMLPTVFVLLLVLDQFDLYVDLAVIFRIVWALFSLGFFVWMIRAPPHRPRLWD
jgi:hypothetical protein